jgi:hypothetical protein
MTQRVLVTTRHTVLGWLCLVATSVACSSPTSPTSPTSAAQPQVSASHTTIRPGDTVAFVLSGAAPDRRVLWQFTTSDLSPIAFVPVVAGPGSEVPSAIDTHHAVIRVVLVAQPTRLIAEAWSVPGFSDNPPAALIASLGIDALP